MTTLRTAAQQALEALAWISAQKTGGMIQRKATEPIAALRASLAEPVQEPVIDRRLVLQAIDDLNMVDDVLETHWVEHDVGTGRVNEVLCSVLKAIDLAPSQRVPLTREEAIALWADKSDGPSNSEIVLFARAVERAHGIT